MVLVAPLKKSRSTSACKGGGDWSAWPETAKVSIHASRGAAAVMHDRFVDGDRGNASDEDAEKEMLYLREKVVEAVREGDARETKHLLGLSLGRRLMPAREKVSMRPFHSRRTAQSSTAV